ncbi:MAG: hypothetical protein MR308_10210 [Lachnospiraceae bacterium]|nr:hypothetical protein [Lachnospiraceae bacterium]
MKITKVNLYDVRLPLITPYGNSMGTLYSFTSIIAVISGEDGSFGLGEATPAQPEYQEETLESVWAFVTEHGKKLVGKELDEAYEYLLGYKQKFPFACTAFMTGIEELRKDPSITPREEIRFPLVGIVNPKQGESLEEHIARRIEEGYKTLKVKVGFLIDKDIQKAQKIQKLVGDKAFLRFDANQAYTYEEAVRFVTEIDPYQIQLLEQPFNSGVWDEMTNLRQVSKIPLMLDESIYNEADVERAGEGRCADYIKFKLMKSSSGRLMAKEIETARKWNIEALIGNGVATDIGCYQESVIGYQNHIVYAGEQNGLLKPKETLFAQKLSVEDGNIIIPADFDRQLDLEKVRFYSIHEEVYEL